MLNNGNAAGPSGNVNGNNAVNGGGLHNGTTSNGIGGLNGSPDLGLHPNQPRSPLMAQTENKVKHTMHGVSHAIPGELDDIEKPPPVHYGVDEAIRSGSVALKQQPSRNFFSNENLTSIVKEPSLARGQSTDSIVQLKVTSSPEISPAFGGPAVSAGSSQNKKVIHVSPPPKQYQTDQGKKTYIVKWAT